MYCTTTTNVHMWSSYIILGRFMEEVVEKVNYHIGKVHGGGGGEGELSYWEGSWRRWWRR